jgi:hypothetical protein
MASMGYLTVDSCHSRWTFDTERLRFRRMPKGPGLELLMATTQWRPYHELLLDPLSDSFEVILNDAGTRVLRSWRHREGVCPQCGAARTEELAVDDIALAGSA